MAQAVRIRLGRRSSTLARRLTGSAAQEPAHEPRRPRRPPGLRLLAVSQAHHLQARRSGPASAAAPAPTAATGAPPTAAGSARCRLPRDQVGQRPAGQVRRATRRRRRSRPPSRARSRGRGPTEAHQSRGDADRAAPAVRDLRRRRAPGRARPSVRRSAAKTAGIAVERRPDRRAEVVRRAAAAEGEPAVRRALPVDDQVPQVAEGRAGRPGRSRPRRTRAAARSRSSASRPGRCAPLRPGQPRRVALGRADHVRAARTVPGRRRDRWRRLDLPDRRPLVDRDAALARTASARPRTSRAGWIAAQCGV